MSGRIVGEVLNHAPADLRPLDLLVLVSLAESAHDKDRTARAESSAEAIAYRVRSTPSSVRNSLLRLKQRALIRPVHDKVHRGHAQNWIVSPLSSYHREGALLKPINGSPRGDAFDQQKASPPDDANAHSKASPPGDT